MIPRPETELLVEWVLSHRPHGDLSVVDAGTGSGAIAIALASERLSWHVLAIDRSIEALLMAQRNVRTHHLEEQVQVCQGSWCESLNDACVDVLVSNPPYIDACDAHLTQGDVRFEPLSALVSDAHGLADIRLIATQAQRVLKPGALLALEHGWQQAADVRALLQSKGFTGCLSVKDLAGHERITIGYNGV